MDATTVLLIATLALVYASALFVGAYAIARVALRNASGEVVSQVRSLIPEAQSLFGQLKSESGRARNLLKKAGTVKPDDDDLIALLDHPMAAGFVKGAGLDVDKLKAGDLEEWARAKQVAAGKQENHAEAFL